MKEFIFHKVITPPDEEPVTLSEMRKHLGITQTSDTSRDSIITGRIVSARQWAEANCRKAFITQTLRAYAEDFPRWYCDYEIKLQSPLISIVSIVYLDIDGIEQTLDSSKYLVDTVRSCVIPAYGESWPSARVQRNSIQITYKSGYGDAIDVPDSIKDAIRFIVGQWEVFQSSIEGITRPFTIPNAAKQLLDFYTDMRELF